LGTLPRPSVRDLVRLAKALPNRAPTQDATSPRSVPLALWTPRAGRCDGGAATRSGADHPIEDGEPQFRKAIHDVSIAECALQIASAGCMRQRQAIGAATVMSVLHGPVADRGCGSNSTRDGIAIEPFASRWKRRVVTIPAMLGATA